MNDKLAYIALYPTDFLADTYQLGNTELGIYWRLLLVYYRDQRPLPADTDTVRRIAMATTPEEGKLLDHVLVEFFSLDALPDGTRQWRHRRAEREIAEAQERWLANRTRTERARAALAERRATGLSQSLSQTLPQSLSQPLSQGLSQPLSQSLLQAHNQSQNQSQSQRRRKDSPSSSAAPLTDPALRAFDEFWSLYPRKAGKGDARKAWARVKRPVETLDAIRTALTWQASCEQWTRDGGQYVPHPATYIRQERWTDEPATAGDGNDGALVAAARAALSGGGGQ